MVLRSHIAQITIKISNFHVTILSAIFNWFSKSLQTAYTIGKTASSLWCYDVKLPKTTCILMVCTKWLWSTRVKHVSLLVAKSVIAESVIS